MICKNFQEWKDCIENKCKIQLSTHFIDERLMVYLNESDPETLKFKKLYGAAYLRNIVHWLIRAKNIKN
jgi:hypothetical protein